MLHLRLLACTAPQMRPLLQVQVRGQTLVRGVALLTQSDAWLQQVPVLSQITVEGFA